MGGLESGGLTTGGLNTGSLNDKTAEQRRAEETAVSRRLEREKAAHDAERKTIGPPGTNHMRGEGAATTHGDRLVDVPPVEGVPDGYGPEPLDVCKNGFAALMFVLGTHPNPNSAPVP